MKEDLKHPLGSRYKEDKQGLSYRIHIASTVQMLRSNVLNRALPILIKEHNGKLDYYIGDVKTYQEASELKKDILQNNDVDFANIVPFIKMQPTTDVDPLLDKYPNLSLYKQYGN